MLSIARRRIIRSIVYKRTISSSDTELPKISGKAGDEFHAPRKGRIPPQWKRYLFLAYDKAFLGRSLKVLGISALGVYGLGGYEASLLLKSNVEFMDSARFVNAYALEQLVPSCVWGTKPADLVALSIGQRISLVALASAAMGENELKRFDMPGRVSLDLWLHIKNGNAKLNSYPWKLHRERRHVGAYNGSCRTW